MTKIEIEKEIARVVKEVLSYRLREEEVPDKLVKEMEYYYGILNTPEWQL